MEENKKPYRVNNGNYVYGVSEYDQPMIPYYNSMAHHKKFPLREFPNDKIRDDGVPYKYIGVDQACAACDKCNRCRGSRIDRNVLLTSIVNVESSIDKVLTITIYGVTEDLDRTIRMKIGSKYCISYATENGLQTVTGVFKELSPNVPDECTKYIGNFSSVTTAAYICLDCSTTGSSDKRLIYIASIRFIEEIFDEGDDKYANYTQDEKLSLALNSVDSIIEKIGQYNDIISQAMEIINQKPVKTITTITGTLNGGTIQIDGDGDIVTEFTYNPNTKTVTLPDDINDITISTTTEVLPEKEINKPPVPCHPIPYPGPLIVGMRPPFGPPPTYIPYKPTPHSSNQDELINLSQIDNQAITDIINDIKDAIDSYILTQNNENSNNTECHCCNNS